MDEVILDEATSESSPIGHESSLGFPVVGIGASAGGITALQRLLEQTPSDNGMAFVVVMHLSPNHASALDTVLQGSTRMTVTQVQEPTTIEKNHVYVIAPQMLLTMVDGRLEVGPVERPRGGHVAIDRFFRTLADAHGVDARAIVLSGMGSDGSLGLARVREKGGVTIAQHPEDAEYDSMPRSAIEAGVVDIVLPVVEIPQRLIDIRDNAEHIEVPMPADGVVPGANPPSSEQAADAAERALQDILHVLRNRTGHDFRHYKRATILRRIERRLQIHALPDLPNYSGYLHSTPAETQALLKDLLIGVTQFFRDRAAFETLERDVLPQIVESRDPDDGPVRVWVAGCSSGEEAYSHAMLLAEASESGSEPFRYQVFASDIDERALALGRTGVYPEAIAGDVPPARLRRFFTKDQSRYIVKKGLRERVLFTVHNLLRDPPFSKLDLISCRNLLIYLSREIQAEILQIFHFALKPGGYLFLGSAESVDAYSRYFVPVDKKHRIYRARAAAETGRRTPSLPLGAGTRLDHRSPIATVIDRQQPIHADVHRRVLELYAPPSIVLDESHNIVHLSDNAGRFLHFSGGEPSRHALEVVLPELRLDLRTALFQASQTTRSVEARRVRLTREDGVRFINMVVRPFRDPESGSTYTLVTFDEVDASLGEQVDTGDTESTVVAHLEEELRRTREQLRFTVDQAQTSMEEQRASNEELQAINEELRSTSEELETSKEELQSINEELMTVNAELKAKVEETAQVNDDLQNLIASTDIATIFVDRSMRIKRYTPRAVDLFYLVSSDVGRSLHDVKHRLVEDDIADDAATVFETLLPVEREVRTNDKRWYLCRIVPYRSAEDRIEGAVMTFVEITARVRAEERLRQGEERMRLVAESTRDYAIITTDTTGIVTSWNLGAERIFGYKEAEIVGRSGDVLFVPEDRAAGGPESERYRARAHGRAEDERWHQRKDGVRIYCSGVTTPLNEGEFVGFAKIARDLTDHKRTEHDREAELRHERNIVAEERAANQMKDEFLAVMSHELKNPLNLVQLNSELLARLPDVRRSEIALRAAETIQKAAVSQSRIIDDLLDMSRLHTGKLGLEPRPVDCVELVSQIGEVLRNDERYRGHRQISVEVTDEPAIVLADRVRVEQIIWNLVSNACKFTAPGGHVTIKLSMDPTWVCVQVTDDGIGIAPSFMPRLFRLFSQADRYTTRTEGGLGIGLALARQLAELQSGTLDASSPGLGKGSMFTLKLPRVDGRIEEIQVAQENGGQRLVGVRILIVDDSAECVDTMKTLLELEGANVETALRGVEALELLQLETFDLIVSDIAMPDMDGYDLIRRIRKLPKAENTPAIALTGFGRRIDVETAEKSGFNSHLTKPVLLDPLLTTIRGLIKRRGGDTSRG